MYAAKEEKEREGKIKEALYANAKKKKKENKRT
jgi:hypothetical protein